MCNWWFHCPKCYLGNESFLYERPSPIIATVPAYKSNNAQLHVTLKNRMHLCSYETTSFENKQFNPWGQSINRLKWLKPSNHAFVFLFLFYSSCFMLWR